MNRQTSQNEHTKKNRCQAGLAGTFYYLKEIAPLVLEIQKCLAPMR